MNREIDKLIFNALVTHRDVALPGVGSIVVGRRSAHMVAKNRIVGPQTTFSFSSEQRGRSVAAMIVEVSGISEERATDIYNEWLNASLRDGRLAIEDVGAIEGIGTRAKFVVDTQFDKMINPEKDREYRLERRINYGLYSFAALCACVAIGVGLLFASGVSLNEIDFLPKGDKTTSQSRKTEAVAEVVIEESDRLDCEEPREAKRSHNEAPGFKDSKAPNDLKVSNELPALESGRSYAVYGVYSKRESADHYLQVVSDRYADVEARIYRYGDRYMIALAEENSRNACAAKVERLKSRSGFFASVWVYTEPR